MVALEVIAPTGEGISKKKKKNLRARASRKSFALQRPDHYYCWRTALVPFGVKKRLESALLDKYISTLSMVQQVPSCAAKKKKKRKKSQNRRNDTASEIFQKSYRYEYELLYTTPVQKKSMYQKTKGPRGR